MGVEGSVPQSYITSELTSMLNSLPSSPFPLTRSPGRIFSPTFYSSFPPFPEKGHDPGFIPPRPVRALCLVSKLARQVVSRKRSS